MTIDGETVEGDGTVTVRDRDSMEQIRVPIEGLLPALEDRLATLRNDSAG